MDVRRTVEKWVGQVAPGQTGTDVLVRGDRVSVVINYGNTRENEGAARVISRELRGKPQVGGLATQAEGRSTIVSFTWTG